MDEERGWGVGGGFSEGVGVSGEGFGVVPIATEPIFVYCYVPGCSEEAFGHVASLRTGRSDGELRGSTSVHGCKELPTGHFYGNTTPTTILYCCCVCAQTETLFNIISIKCFH